MATAHQPAGIGAGEVAGGTPTPLVSGDVRRHNLALVLNHVVAAGPSARSDIATGTNLTRGAVTALVGILTDARILREVPRGENVARGRRGRARTLLGLAADSLALVAAQVDADHATAVAVNLAGDTLARFEEKHGRPMGDPDAVLDVLARVLQQTLKHVEHLDRQVADLSVVAFAPVGGDPVVVLADTDLGWGRVDVVAGLRERLPDLPPDVRLVSDVTVAALAEHRLLPEVGDLVYLKSNSGIGGAIIADGRLIEGGHGFAGALGHVPIDHDGAPCECGQRGCLVTVAGPDVVLVRAGLGAELRREGLTVALDTFTRRVLAGDEVALQVWRDAAGWVARTLQVLALSVDPEVIVLGGYWESLTEQIETAFRSNRPTLVEAAAVGTPLILPARLGMDAALMGAWWSARARLVSNPLQLAAKPSA